MMVILGYTLGVKTAVTIPDPIFEAADRLARRRRMSRSALYAEALELLLLQQGADEVTAKLDEIYADIDFGVDPFVATAAAALFADEDW